MRSRRVLGAAAALGIVVCGFWGCSEDEATNVTISGGGNGGGTTTTSNPTTTDTTSTTSSGESPVGQACDDDDACGEGYYCLLPSQDVTPFATFMNTEGTGGPAGGYCTKSCEDNTDCPGSGDLCLGDGADAFCVAGCTFGEPDAEYLNSDLDPDKCHGRDNLMCVPVSNGGAVCIPVCGMDTECAPRGCNLRNGLCSDDVPTGDGLASACTQDDPGTPADEDNCAGFCLQFIDSQGNPTGHMCSARCSRGGDLQETTNCGGVMAGICAFGPVINNVPSELGDFGYCTGSCIAQDQCDNADGMFCWDVQLWNTYGVGYCFFATECPNGNECSAGQICVQTGDGPVCLQEGNPGEPLIPLTSGSGGGGGVGGAGGAGGS